MSGVIRKLLILTIIICAISGQETESFKIKLPTVMIATLVRNKAHTLPYFLTYLEELNYPKDRIALWWVPKKIYKSKSVIHFFFLRIRSDHNEDNTIQVIDTWVNRTKDLYHSVDFKFKVNPKLRSDEDSFTHWSEQRFADVIRLKEEALVQAKQMWADYVFVSIWLSSLCVHRLIRLCLVFRCWRLPNKS